MGSSVFFCLSFVFGGLQLVSGQQCPYQWAGYSASSKCYRFVLNNKLSWQGARAFCKVHGGDLLRLDSVREKNWVYGQVRNIAAHNTQVTPSNWWTGLNSRETATSWVWADSSPAKYINWKPGEPNSNAERCGEIMYGNSFNDEGCADANNFICSRDRGVPLTCDADRGWQALNGQCYKAYTARKNWNAAQQQCDHDGGSLATVPSSSVQQTFYEFAVAAHTHLYIGIHSLKTGTTTNSWIVANGTQLTTPTFWHTGGNTLLIDRRHLNDTCVDVSNTGGFQKAWLPSTCSIPRGFICQKPQGVCAPGWIGHRNYCYQFDALYRLTFTAAASYCQNQGSEMMRVATTSDQAFLVSYLDEMRDSHVTSFWIGLSDNNVDAGPYKWRNGQTVSRQVRNYWATSNHVPTNTKGRQDCVYISTTDTAGRWRTTPNCASTKAFVCRIPMGRSLKGQPSTPRPQFGCPNGWRLHRDTCFRLYDRSTNAQTAGNLCQNTKGATLAKIISTDMQGFVNGLIKNRGIAYYIGLNDKTKDGVYVWNNEAVPATYTNWARGQPSDPSHTKNCVVLRSGQWSMVPCSQPHMYICSLLANSAFAPVSTTPAVDWTVKCGPGWESNPVTDSCYQFVDLPLAWPDARLQCRVSGGDLVAIETISEQNFIAGRLTSMSSIAVWTGANDRRTEGGWNWVSGDPFAFLNWAPGQPGGSRGQGTDCVAMLTSSAQWDDVNCNTRNGFVCEKTGNVATTKPTTTKATTAPAGRVLGCFTGWLPYAGSCYRISRASVTWSRASQLCGTAGSRLASILSADEQNFIVGNLPKSNNTLDGVWVGLNDQQVDMSFQWSDGNMVTYTKWGTSEPNNWNNRNEDCVEVKLKTGLWNDAVCDSSKKGFICKRDKSFVSATQSPYQVNCRTFDRGYGPYCYSLVGAPLAWSSANARCKSALNGTLATVNDRFLQAFLSSWLVMRGGYYWIGINDNAKNGSWADGTQIQFTNWVRNHTGNEVNATCVALKGRTPMAGFWQNFPCTQPHSLLCQYPRVGYTPPPTPTAYPNVNCPQGWAPNRGFCYKVYSPTPALNWMQASSYCQGLGGNLASFHANNNDSFIYPLVQNLQWGSYKIGLNDRDTEGGFKWTDGSALDYTNWNQGEPNDGSGFEDCVSYVKDTKSWNDDNCYSQGPFICMITRGSQILTTAVPPTAVSSPLCGGGDWMFYYGNCYLPSPMSGPNATLSWYDAATYCQGQGTTLASFHSFADIEAVLGATIKRTASMMWIGLNILGGDAYRWTDGSPVDYINWNPNEPNDFGGVERCAEMTKESGRWNDEQCNMERGFICKRPVNSFVTPPTPRPYPPGGCQNGFTRVPGGRNKCFYAGGGPPPHRKTYNEAVTFCRSFGSGYDIASIEDIFEQEFLIAMTYSFRNSLWIGMEDTRGNNKFFWHDNAPVQYTNWDQGEPTSARASSVAAQTENCVVLRMNPHHEGRWADLDCTAPRGYVCQSRQIPGVPQIITPTTCLGNYTSYRQACYRFSTTAKSWNDAQADCKKDGADLTSILDVYEKAFVLYQAYKNTPYWIGLTDSFSPGLYGWSDGYPVTYTNWGWGEPSYGQLYNDQDNHGCVYVNGHGRWNDSDCGLTLKYVCKHTTATPPPTPPPTLGKCSNPNAIDNAGFCYYVSVNVGRSWPEANFACRKLGMELASVHSDGEMQFLTTLTSQAKVTNPKYRPNIWLGMSKGPQGSYMWTDGTSVNYLSWASGEPSTLGASGNQEECIEYNRVSGGWNDVGCMSNRGYVCKAPKPTVTSAMPGSFMPINPGPSGQPGSVPRTFPVIMPATDSQGVRTGQGVSRLPPITEPIRNPIYPGGVPSGPQQITGGTNGLSSGGIAGVVIASLVILVVAALFVLYLKKSGRIKTPDFDKAGPSAGFDNALYDRGNDSVKIDSDA